MFARNFLAFLTPLVFFVGCSSPFKAETRPVFFENDKFRSTSESDRDTARANCMAVADKYIVSKNPYTQMARKAAIGAVVGTTTGAVSGSIFGDVDEGIASGAAVGTLVGFLQSVIDSSTRPASYERFVENCLQKDGFEILEWREPDSD